MVEGFSVGFGFGSGDGGGVGALLASVMTGKGKKGLVLLEGDLVVGLQLSTLLLSFDLSSAALMVSMTFCFWARRVVTCSGVYSPFVIAFSTQADKLVHG